MAKKDLTKLQLEFLDWYCVPADDRLPPTQKEWAEEHDVTQNTLQNWKKHPEFQKRLEVEMKRQAASPEKVNMVVDSLYKKAINGDVRAAMAYLQATGNMPDKNANITIKTESASELSDDELRAVIAEYAQAESHKRSKDAQLALEGVTPRDVNAIYDIIEKEGK